MSFPLDEQVKVVEIGGVEPPSVGCKPTILPLNEIPRLKLVWLDLNQRLSHYEQGVLTFELHTRSDELIIA